MDKGCVDGLNLWTRLSTDSIYAVRLVQRLNWEFIIRPLDKSCVDVLTVQKLIYEFLTQPLDKGCVEGLDVWTHSFWDHSLLCRLIFVAARPNSDAVIPQKKI